MIKGLLMIWLMICVYKALSFSSSLESLGFMLMKMQIHATEDSYEKTKSKMTAAEQEQKNIWYVFMWLLYLY